MRDSESARKTRDDAEAIADRLHSAAIHLLRRLRREDATSGLSAPRLSALSVIVFGGPLTLGELANAEQVRPPTMTRLVSASSGVRQTRRTSGSPASARRQRDARCCLRAAPVAWRR
jgi:hypothetical protein